MITPEFLYHFIRILYALLTILSIMIFIMQTGVLSLPKCIRYEEEATGKVSVIIPVRNEKENLLNIIKSVTHPGIDVIIVDDESTDGSYEEALEHCSKCGCRVIRVSKPREWVGKAYACYMGYLESNGDYIVFLDSDTIITREDLNCIVKYLGDYDVVSGIPRFKCGNILSSLVEYAFNSLVAIFYPPWRVGEKGRPWLAGAVMGWRKDAYEKIGGHKRVYNKVVEDAELGRIAYSEGLKIGFVRGGWYTNWSPKYKDIENFFTRIMLFINIGSLEALSLLLLAIVANLATYILPFLILTGLMPLLEGIVFLLSFWATPILQIATGVIKPRILSIPLYPIGYVIVGWLLYKAIQNLRKERVIEWRGRKIVLTDYG